MDRHLDFQDIPHGTMQTSALLDIESDSEMTSSQTKMTENPLEESIGASSQKTQFWSFGFFQNLFDVDTDQVLSRLYGAVVPYPKSFLQHHVNGKPDLYGPFWICTTLVFSIAISGNLANYLQAAGDVDYHWKYDFHAVTFSATAIYSYAWIVPLGLWGVLQWMVPEEHRLSFLDLLCLYGYSLTIYIPVSVFWVIQLSWLQWLLALTGASLSATVLVTSIWPAVSQIQTQRYVVLGVVLVLHVVLAAGFMLYFFHASPVSEKTVAETVTSVLVNNSSKSNSTVSV
ncbi:protein YIPF2 [Frankliniella occidentalis]|uniref:Protein YIPF n=1 Tax=Frankliniella occidentalis TaxID=133901 RepID=A0A6J1SYJ1_FRAOC|nr:protein YIPF2 [Frankliniella occidentalis]